MGNYARQVPRILRDVSPDQVWSTLAAALDGTGPAIRIGAPPESGDVEVPAEVAVVMMTSGSTGRPRQVMFTAAALVGAAQTTVAALGVAGDWLLALPLDHVAGLQVLLRAQVSGTKVHVLPSGPFTVDAFVRATQQLPAARYCSLVPTQIARLAADPVGLDALRTYTAVLVGGAPLPAPLRTQTSQVRMISTYGATETGGGVVWDGKPLPGTTVQIVDGLVQVHGPTLAYGYLHNDQPEPFTNRNGQRWFVTSDQGELDSSGSLHITGRADDVIITGGVNIWPQTVEDVLRTCPGVAQVCVVGLSDTHWGQIVTAVVVPDTTRPDLAPLALNALRQHAKAQLPPAAVPQALLLTTHLPTVRLGKPDRQATLRWAGQHQDQLQVHSSHQARTGKEPVNG